MTTAVLSFTYDELDAGPPGCIVEGKAPYGAGYVLAPLGGSLGPRVPACQSRHANWDMLFVWALCSSHGLPCYAKHDMPIKCVTHEAHPAEGQASIQPLSLALHAGPPVCQETSWQKHLLACCVLKTDARDSLPPPILKIRVRGLEAKGV